MSITLERPPQAPPPERPRRAGLVEWITTTNHKRIGLLYIVTTFLFFLAGGLLSLLMRAELAGPGLRFLSRNQYNQLSPSTGRR